MATAIERTEQQNDVSWDNCPSELLLIIFEMMPAPTLASCMFVNSRWKRLVEYIVEHHEKWEEIVSTVIINKGASFRIKGKTSLSWRQVYYNYILWNNIQRANISLYHVQEVNNIKMINIYRDNLIVVTSKNVQYYQVKTFDLLRTVAITCREFLENDHMIAIVLDNHDSCVKLELYKKSSIHDFNIDISNVHFIEKVLFYKIECNRCYVINHRNCLFIYAILYPVWEELFVARYYGSSYETCAMNVFDGQVYLMVSGSVLWADMKADCFRKMLEINVPNYERALTSYCKMFHRYGFVFGVTVKGDLQINRFTLFKNNVFLYKLPNLTTMTQHADILFLGYLDGTIEFIIPRDLSTTEPLHSFNLKDFKRSIADVEVRSIDVHEDNGIQHLFIATSEEIFHLHVTHPNCEHYMWNKYTNLVSLIADESVEGLAFKNRTELPIII